MTRRREPRTRATKAPNYNTQLGHYMGAGGQRLIGKETGEVKEGDAY